MFTRGYLLHLAQACADRRLHCVWTRLPAQAVPLGFDSPLPRQCANDGPQGPVAA